VLRHAGDATKPPIVTLSAVGGDVALYGLINGRMVRETTRHQSFQYRFKDPGVYDITALDILGNYDRVSIKIIR
jgi:membrane carboxypeptidase/penicillin-binding protein PbpC